MKFPSEQELNRMRKKLAKKRGFLMLDPDANAVAKFRFRLCQDLLNYAQKNNLNTVDMAKFLGISKADVSRIFNHRISRFSTDKLLRLYEKIKPDFELKVS